MGSYGANRCGSHAALHGKVIAQPSRDRNKARFHRVSFDDPGVKVHVIDGDHHEQISSCLSISRCVFGARRGGVWEGAKQSPMTFSAHTERLHVLEKERNSVNAEAGLEARIELLQRMPIFGGIRSDILQFL